MFYTLHELKQLTQFWAKSSSALFCLRVIKTTLILQDMIKIWQHQQKQNKSMKLVTI